MSLSHPLTRQPIPAGWKVLTVDELKANEKSSCVAGPFGSSISSKYFVDEGVPVIRGSNLTAGVKRFVSDTFVYVSEERAKKYTAQHVVEDDLVFTCWGSIGHIGIIPKDGPFEEYIISNKQLKLRVNKEIVRPLYAYLYFASSLGVDYVKSYAKGAAVPGISLGILKGLEVAVPPLLIQDRIVSLISAYDDLIENNTRRIEILEEMARRLYEEWFVHFRFPGHEEVRFKESELGRIPEGWEVSPFTDLADVLSGGTPKKSEERFWGGVIPFYTPKDAPRDAYALETAAFITEEGLSKCSSQLYPQNTVFITARGTVGKVALASRDMAMNQSCYALKGRDSFGQLFLFLALKNAVHELKAKSHGAVFDTIIKDTFKLLKVVAPDIAVASRFEASVNPIFSLILNMQQQNTNLRAQRDLLLPKLVSGEIDVSNILMANDKEVEVA